MPFQKTSEGKYKSPSGRIFTEKQVKLYNATGGFDKKRMLNYKLGKAMKNLNAGR